MKDTNELNLEIERIKGVGKYTSNFTPPSGAFLT